MSEIKHIARIAAPWPFETYAHLISRLKAAVI